MNKRHVFILMSLFLALAALSREAGQGWGQGQTTAPASQSDGLLRSTENILPLRSLTNADRQTAAARLAAARTEAASAALAAEASVQDEAVSDEATSDEAVSEPAAPSTTEGGNNE